LFSGILGLGVNQEAKERKGQGPKEGHKHGPKDRPKDLVSILGHGKMQILQQMPGMNILVKSSLLFLCFIQFFITATSIKDCE
jgi:hypothetical protein